MLMIRYKIHYIIGALVRKIELALTIYQRSPLK